LVPIGRARAAIDSGAIDCSAVDASVNAADTASAILATVHAGGTSAGASRAGAARAALCGAHVDAACTASVAHVRGIGAAVRENGHATRTTPARATERAATAASAAAGSTSPTSTTLGIVRFVYGPVLGCGGRTAIATPTRKNAQTYENHHRTEEWKPFTFHGCDLRQ
jgi:hypothetical protein